MNIKCPHCGTEYEVEQSDVGRRVVCESCGNGFVVGGQQSAPKCSASATAVPQDQRTNAQFCSSCGARLNGVSRFCPTCGSPVGMSPQVSVATPNGGFHSANGTQPMRGWRTQSGASVAMQSQMSEPISERYAWVLALLPQASLLLTLFEIPALGVSCAIGAACISGVIVDINELKKAGLKVSGSLYAWGILLPPVYLFIRANKYSKNNVPAIVWCVGFGVNVIVQVVYALARIARW